MSLDQITNRLEARLRPMIGQALEDRDFTQIVLAIREVTSVLRQEPGMPQFGVTPEFHDGVFSGVSVSLKVVW